ncbi:hypothetical protein IE53DRAFT_307657, partial [Violaceomyces palustris]
LISDPVSASSGQTVLKVGYPKGSYVPSNDPIGEAVIQDGYNDANSSSTFRPSLLLSYSVAFPSNFDFVKGGKLPGLYSSVGISNASDASSPYTLDANTDGCSGGARDGVGESCWSVRLMWRENGEGEVYAYFPTNPSGSYDPCSQRKDTMICNDKFGTSIGRGSFRFNKGGGGYTDVNLYVQLNSLPNLANGGIQLWIDGVQVVNEQGLLLRT